MVYLGPNWNSLPPPNSALDPTSGAAKRPPSVVGERDQAPPMESSLGEENVRKFLVSFPRGAILGRFLAGGEARPAFGIPRP